VQISSYWHHLHRCSVWPSSLYLSEFVLSFPDIFSNKSCFEVTCSIISLSYFRYEMLSTLPYSLISWSASCCCNPFPSELTVWFMFRHKDYIFRVFFFDWPTFPSNTINRCILKCSILVSEIFVFHFLMGHNSIFFSLIEYLLCPNWVQVGSGVGLVGICLSHVKASQVCCFYYLCCIEKITFSSYVSTSNVNLEEHAWKFIITYHFHKWSLKMWKEYITVILCSSLSPKTMQSIRHISTTFFTRSISGFFLIDSCHLELVDNDYSRPKNHA
jgi:hypothetical protein